LETLCRFCLPKIIAVDKDLLKLFGNIVKVRFFEPRCIGTENNSLRLKLHCFDMLWIGAFLFTNARTNKEKDLLNPQRINNKPNQWSLNVCRHVGPPTDRALLQPRSSWLICFSRPSNTRARLDRAGRLRVQVAGPRGGRAPAVSVVTRKLSLASPRRGAGGGESVSPRSVHLSSRRPITRNRLASTL